MRYCWPRRPLFSAAIEIIDGDRGKEYPKHSDFSGSGYCLFLNTGNVRPDGFDFSNCQFISDEKDQRLRKGKLARHDLVMTPRGTIGNVAYYDDNVPYENFRINSGMVIFRADALRLHPKFLYHFLRSPDFIGQTISMRSGVAQPQFPIRDIRRVELPTPDLAIQRRIASVLSAYDDLIENNRRRMALLEEAARQLYREWFVRLRFPGHEHTRITDGVPEGWREVRFEEALAEMDSGGRPRGGAKDDDGIPSIGAENVLGIGQYDYSKEKYVPEEYFEQMTRGVVKNRDVVLYKDGANIGRASYFGEAFPHGKCAVNEHVFILRTQPFVGQSFLYFWITREENRQAIANLNANTAQPGISQEKLKGLRILVPAEPMTRAFNEAVDAQVKQIFALALMNRKLSTARDLLLPHLMSGEIAV